MYLRAYQRLGLKGLFEHLYMFRRIKEGTLVGVDSKGTKYYENKDLPYGQHRWYEPKEYAAQQLYDASNIPPEWHSWMHCTTDEVPGTPERNDTPALVEHSDVPASLNTHRVPASVRNGEWRPNPTLNRERGYGVKNIYQTQLGGNGYYVQPGHPLSPYYTKYEPKMVQNAWKPTVSMLPAGSRPSSKFAKFRAQREAMNKAEEAEKQKQLK